MIVGDISLNSYLIILSYYKLSYPQLSRSVTFQIFLRILHAAYHWSVLSVLFRIIHLTFPVLFICLSWNIFVFFFDRFIRYKITSFPHQFDTMRYIFNFLWALLCDISLDFPFYHIFIIWTSREIVPLLDFL